MRIRTPTLLRTMWVIVLRVFMLRTTTASSTCCCSAVTMLATLVFSSNKTTGKLIFLLLLVYPSFNSSSWPFSMLRDAGVFFSTCRSLAYSMDPNKFFSVFKSKLVAAAKSLHIHKAHIPSLDNHHRWSTHPATR